ncbi:hypothetical protein V1527DRAFT_515436 [Lipomyces starkeyi]
MDSKKSDAVLRISDRISGWQSSLFHLHVVGQRNGRAYAAGGLTKRSGHPEKVADSAMAAVGLGTDKLRPFLINGVVASCNFRRPRGIGHLEAAAKVARCVCSPLTCRSSVSFSSYATYGAAYEESIAAISASSEPSIPLFLPVTGEMVNSAHSLTTSFWPGKPVLFSTGVRRLIAADFHNQIFIEIGPHSALARPLRQIFQGEGVPLTYVPTLQCGKDDTESICNALGSLLVNNIAVDWEALNPTGCVLSELPAYSWNHSVR